MTQNVKNLSKRETRFLTTLSSQGKDLFTFKEAADILGQGKGGVKQFLYVLREKGWLKSLEREKYLIVPFQAGPEGEWSEESFVIASHLIEPYTISYWSALNYYGYTEQIPHTVFVASIKRKFKNEIEVLGVPYRFVTLTEHKFFGATKIWLGDKQINITDKEKTIVDCLDHPEYCGGIAEAAKGLQNSFEDKIDLDKLTRYARKMQSGVIFKRLGYLAEVLELPVENYLHVWREEISAGYSLLDPTLEKTGKHNSSWHLRVNVSEQRLTSWRGHS